MKTNLLRDKLKKKLLENGKETPKQVEVQPEEEHVEAVEQVQEEPKLVPQEMQDTSVQEELAQEEESVQEESVQEESKEPVQEELIQTEPNVRIGKNKGKKSKKQETIRLTTTDIDLMEAVSRLSPSFTDKEWDKFKKDIQEKLAAIQIPPDINPGSMREINSSLSALHQRVALAKAEHANMFYIVSEAVETIQKTNIGEARNDLERRKNGILACMNYKEEDGATINLLELKNEFYVRHNFLCSVLDDLHYKEKLLVNMSAALKLEKELLPS